MKLISVLLVSLTLIYCGGGETDKSMKIEKKVKKVSLSEMSNPKSTSKILKITGVKFDSFVDVENDIHADPVLSVPETVKDFKFRWFVNDREIDGENNASLSRDYFRENDWVYCRVSILEKGGNYPEFKSNMVKVRGPAPKVSLTTVKDFDFPGVFRYKINAEMPELNDRETEYTDEEENDPAKTVRFELVSPLDKGIELDPVTGEIVWDITPEMIGTLGDTVTIKFNIISPAGRKINSSISLSLIGDDKKNKNSGTNSPMGEEIE